MSSGDDDCDDDGGADEPGDDCDGDGGVIHIDDVEAADAPSAAGSGSQPSQHEEAIASERSLEIAAAHRLLLEDAVRSRDDAMLRMMRNKIRGHEREQNDKCTEVGTFLRKRAQEQRVADEKRRRCVAEEERLAAKDLEETKAITAKANQAAAEARERSLQQIGFNRRDAAARKKEAEFERAGQRWLQTTYPVLLARKSIDLYRDMSAGARDGFGKTFTVDSWSAFFSANCSSGSCGLRRRN